MSILTGNSLRAKAVFKDFDGALVDPTTVSLKYQKPDTTISTVTPTQLSVGTYQQYVTLDQAGTWLFKWIGTGTYGSVEEFTINVVAPALA